MEFFESDEEKENITPTANNTIWVSFVFLLFRLAWVVHVCATNHKKVDSVPTTKHEPSVFILHYAKSVCESLQLIRMFYI